MLHSSKESDLQQKQQLQQQQQQNGNKHNYNNKNTNHHAIDIRATLTDPPATQHYGTNLPTRLSSHVIRERLTNMHSSAVTADSTAVIVNIGGSDFNSAENQSRIHSRRLRRTCSSATYSEVASGFSRRERHFSSSSQSNSRLGNSLQKSGSSTSNTRKTDGSTRRRRETSPKPNESLRTNSSRRHQTTTSHATKLRDATENTSLTKAQQTRHNSPRYNGENSSSGSATASSCNGSCSSDDGDSNSSSTSSGEPNLPYPGFPEIALKYLTQETRPRNWCLKMITNPYPFQNS